MEKLFMLRVYSFNEEKGNLFLLYSISEKIIVNRLRKGVGEKVL